MSDGGPAFPEIKQIKDQHGRPKLTNCGGMSLRDWFAGMVMQGLCSDLGSPHPDDDWNVLALLAGEIADAMLAEREKG